jgi:phosphate transport system substrate-binding protein
MRSRAFLTILVAALAVTVGVSLNSGYSQEKAKVVIKGSTTVLPITLKAIEACKKTMPEVSISVEGSGSGNGIKSLLDGTCDIANSSREMKKEEFAKAAAAKIKVKEVVVAYDMIVPVIHPSNPVTNLTKDQLKGIYDGSISNWKEVGGKDEKIVVISRDTSSGTYEYWHEDVLKKTDTRKDALLQASNGAVVTTVAGNKKAIGYIGFGYLNKRVKALEVNGVIATLENGKSGAYPISRKLYNYVNEATMSPATKDFINFLLSAKGQEIVKQAGFIPLK